MNMHACAHIDFSLACVDDEEELSDPRLAYTRFSSFETTTCTNKSVSPITHTRTCMCDSLMYIHMLDRDLKYPSNLVSKEGKGQQQAGLDGAIALEASVGMVEKAVDGRGMPF